MTMAVCRRSIQEEIRDAAVEAILALQDGAEPAVGSPSPELTTRMMSVCMGEDVGEQYGEMMSTEIARRIEPGREGIALESVEVPTDFKVFVIGTGVAGIVAAHELEQMGVDYEVVEQVRRAGRHLVGQHLSGCRGRHPELPLHLPFRQERLGHALRASGGAAALHGPGGRAGRRRR